MTTIRRRRIVRRTVLTVIAFAALIGAATFIWSRTLLNRAARIEIGQSRADVQLLLGRPVATSTRSIRNPSGNGPPREDVTEHYDPIFSAKARVAVLFEPLGWSPFDLDQAEWPVSLHFDSNDHVDMITRGDVVTR